MGSENPIGADNQQETKHQKDVDPWWIVGFVDGEGCFSVSINRNELATPTNGWQIQPVFQVSQHRDNRDVLEALRTFFGAGTVRSKGPASVVDVFVIYSTIQLLETIIPFFQEHPLRVKRRDFEIFARIARDVRSRRHHRPEVFEELVRLAYSMNARGKQRKRSIGEILEGSSETAR